ncbi:hypothetical protein GCM10027160_53570 [Streptomyces calidiresistens]|uniref:DUF2165 family protein n=1 Tax=Streptomyces calidiresistens TaxID=1485586 RepID=A0A7W3XWT2_9ACTN|nr:DUF2165 family protein [Streptomyces calidiresistens]MBB0230091.1 DUF2165 family protein [Streptomyces calidiresistens]
MSVQSTHVSPDHATSSIGADPSAHAARHSGLLPLAVVLLGGITVWLSLIAINNITDFGTNRALLEQTISMEALKEDPLRANGLEWRAMPESLAVPALIAVIAHQVGTVALMWRAVATGVRVLRRKGGTGLVDFLRHTNHSLVAFLGLFIGFLVGGLWFGYWMHLGPVQQVHLTLLIIGALVAVVVNLLPLTARALVREVTE